MDDTIIPMISSECARARCRFLRLNNLGDCVTRVEVGKSRSQIENTISGLNITIPAKKNYVLIIFLVFWLFGWVFGEITVLSNILNTENEAPKPFMFAWFGMWGMWTVGGVFAVYALFWNIKGKEIINISNGELQYIHELLTFKRSKKYDLSIVTNLRVKELGQSIFGTRNGLEFWGVSGGSIAFDYGRNTHDFGAQLDDSEAEYVIHEIKKQYRNS